MGPPGPPARLVPRGPEFLRGDANLDGRITLADVYSILRYLHLGQPLGCVDAADTDDSGTIDTADWTQILQLIIVRDRLPPSLPAPPYPALGPDPTADGLGCAEGRSPQPAVFDAAPGEGGEGLPAGIVEEDCLCPANFGAGVGVEYIHFRGDRCDTIATHAGARGVQVPLLLRTGVSLEGLTLSLHAPPTVVRLEAIDLFAADTLLSRSGLRHFYSYGTADPAPGFLAFTLLLDSGSGRDVIPQLFDDAVLARLTFSVSPDVPAGTEALIRFAETPGTHALPPIPNELVHLGRSIDPTSCDLRVIVVPRAELFVRGDTDLDGEVSLSDAVRVLLYLFNAHVASLECQDAADADDNGTVNLADSLVVLRHLFASGAPPRPPYPYAGRDPDDPLDPLGCAARD